MCKNLISGFVYINQIDPSIRINLMYFGEQNFIGRQIAGYNTEKAVLTTESATALKKAQGIFQKDGYEIVVYDAYRPTIAVDDFVTWSKDSTDQKMKNFFYPNENKNNLFERGYLATKSGHSRGSTVDISIISSKNLVGKYKEEQQNINDGKTITYLNDGTVDMGTHVDFLDVASKFDSNLIKDVHKKNREYLKSVMNSVGFKSYHKEWWHFTLENEPFLNTYFEFVTK